MISVCLPQGTDFPAWRDEARRLVERAAAPEEVRWVETGSTAEDLFATLQDEARPAADRIGQVRATRAFVELAQMAILHRDPHRFDLLYRLLWRLQMHPRLLDDRADRDVAALHLLARQVRRDVHKMRAFVRFRAVTEGDGEPRFVAWFEPEHFIERHNARFFVDRFASQRWSILTPRLALHWDGTTLCEGPGANRGDAPGEDATEELWLGYYRSIFNPARLKVGAMLKEMPRRYWRNLPEARQIPDMIAGARKREIAMLDAGATRFDEAGPESLDGVAKGIAACRRCPIGCNGTRAVAGEGAAHAPLMIVGEQPGDMEEREGHPFVGPAGQLLDRYLEGAGIDRSKTYVTNAVKHFKFAQRGKRRLHQSPTAGEIDTCRWWLDSERGLVRPRVVLALGASAGRGLTGRTPSIGRERGKAVAQADGSHVWLTAHPSYLLRLDGEAREREQQRFSDDLAGVARLLADH